MSRPLVQFRANVNFMNKHQNVTRSVRRLYDVWNRWEDGTKPHTEPWRAGLAALVAIVAESERDGHRVRGLGGAWSLSDAAVTSDHLVNTKPLNHLSVGFHRKWCHSGFKGHPGRLVFAQCGIGVDELNRALAAKKLALPTSGASDGQTLAGAVSTGTHGAAIDVGSMQDFVLGLHIVAEGGEHHWIEPASRPTMGDAFATHLGAKLVRDDELFRAAVVSFGSFGLVHAMLFEAVPLFLLERHAVSIDWVVARKALASLDLSALPCPHPAERPHHVEFVVNPYATGLGKKGVRMRIMYRRPAPGPIVVPPGTGPVVVTAPGEDLLGVIGTVGDIAAALIPGALGVVLNRFVPLATGALSSPGETFGATEIAGKGLSTEIGVSLADAEAAADKVIKVANANPFPGLLAMRFVKSSEATLGFTRFAPITCTLELLSAWSPSTLAAYDAIWDGLTKAGIAYTLHWGQCLRGDAGYARDAYGPRLDRWLKARHGFLSAKGRRTFSNDLLERYQIDG